MKKILSLLTIFSVSSSSMLSVVSCSPKKNDQLNIDVDDNKDVVNNEMVKGVDVSSYAEVVENYLYENYSDWNSISDGIVTEKSYKDIDSNQEYTNAINKIYSYINSNGEIVYDNMFQILKLKGINSIRLRLWVDPNDANGNTYGGGHNDVDTDIWIMEQAKKYGITDVLLDFQYSDFWADPDKQVIPKSWVNTDIENQVYEYTYSTLKKVSEEVGESPTSVQIGNEVTKGMLWQSNKDKDNFSDSIKYIDSGLKAVNKFDDENKIKIDTILHIESPGTSSFNNALSKYFSDSYLFQNISYLGLTFYPNWNGTLSNIFNVIKDVKSKYNKDCLISETSMPYSQSLSQEIGDTSNDQMNVNDCLSSISQSPSNEVQFISSLMNVLSTAAPNSKVGFYYWEAGWLNFGKTTWATREGIEYCLPGHDDYSTGDTWSNKGLFDYNGTALPALDVISSYQRTETDSTDTYGPKLTKYSASDVTDISDTNASYNNDIYYTNHKVVLDSAYKKRSVSAFLYKRAWSSKENKQIYSYDNNVDIYKDDVSVVNEDTITKFIKSTFTQLMWDEIEVKSISKKNTDGEIKVVVCGKENSFYYNQNESAINVTIKDSSNTSASNIIDISGQSIKFDASKQFDISTLVSSLYDVITQTYTDEELNTKIYNALGITGGISDGNIWLYDDVKKANRYAQEDFITTTNDLRDDTTINSTTLSSETMDWPKKFSNLNKTNYLCIRNKIKSTTFDITGRESWAYPRVLIIKFSTTN